MEPTENERELTERRQRFIDEYILCLNGTKAARLAGYSPASARQEAYRLLTNADIRAAINERMKGVGMGADEAVKRMSNIASTRLNDYFVIQQVQGYEQVPAYLSVLVEKKREEIEFIQEFAKKEGLQLFDAEGGLTDMGKRLTAARQELLALELEKLAHGPDAVKLVPGKPIIVEHADIDLVALARADGEGLLKAFKHTKEGIHVELCDPAAALRDVLRIHGKYEKDNEQNAPKIMPEVRVYTGAPPLANSEKELEE
jgi:phage terminase small subunit